MNPLVSVIIPCYNYGSYLPISLKSVLHQSYENWECIVIDDESSDNTKEIVERYSKEDSRIKYFFQKNAGPAAARNLGITMSTGEYVQFIDADDFIGEDKFKTEIEIFIQDKTVDIVYSDFSLFDSEGTKKWENRKWRQLSANPFNDLINYWEDGLMVPINSFLYKKSCFERWGSFDINFKTHEDWDLNLNFSINGMKYLHHDYIGAFYRIHPNSSSRNDLTLNRKDTMNVLAKYLSHLKINFSQKLLIVNRYAEFFIDFLIERIKYGRIKLKMVLNNDAGKLINLIAIILSPFYLCKKIIKKLIR